MNKYLILLIILINSCAVYTPPLNGEFGSIRKIDNIKINKINTSEVGSPLYVYGKVKIIDKITIKDFGPKFGHKSSSFMLVKNGNLFYNETLGANKLYYYSKPKPNAASTRGVAFDTVSRKYYPFYKRGTNIQNKMLKKGFIDVSQETYKSDDCESCFIKELIYNGVSDNTITLTYREYQKDMIRSAFQQTLTYDLSKDKTIGFKGLRIEIIETNNTNIKYKLLKKFTSK